jgi:hypothetical protein
MSGYFEDMQKGNTHEYKKGAFSLDDMMELIRKQDALKLKHRPITLAGSAYIMAVLNGDKEGMAREEKLMRVRQIGKYRKYLHRFGSGMAKTVAYLDKKHRSSYVDFHWRINVLEHLKYGGVDTREELAVVALQVRMNPDHTFDIEVSAGYEYGGTWQKRILNTGVSYKSLMNQVNYFICKLKIGYY